MQRWGREMYALMEVPVTVRGPRGPLTRSRRRFVNIQFRPGQVSSQNGQFPFSSSVHPLSVTHSRLLRIKHQLRSDFLIKLFRRQKPKPNRSLLQRRPFLMCLFRALGYIYITPISNVISHNINRTYCRSQGDYSILWPA